MAKATQYKVTRAFGYQDITGNVGDIIELEDAVVKALGDGFVVPATAKDVAAAEKTEKPKKEEAPAKSGGSDEEDSDDSDEEDGEDEDSEEGDEDEEDSDALPA